MYQKPRNSTERIREARDAIERLEASLQDNNRYGSVGQNIRDAIARWQSMIDRETSQP